MQSKFNYTLAGALLMLSGSLSADPITDYQQNQAQQNQDLQAIATYLQNLGEYFGYDLTQYCTTGGPCSSNASGGTSGGTTGGSTSSTYSNTLFDENATSTEQINLFNTYLGALLVGGSNTGSVTYNPIVPANTEGYSLLNTLAGQTYSNPPYSSPSTSTVSASPLLDQTINGGYEPDPVSQALLNILSTPSYTYCLIGGVPPSTVSGNTCPYLYREKILSNVIGELQTTQTFFTTSNNANIVPQVNSETLIGPLMYTTTNPNSNTTSSSPNSDQGDNAGLTAQTQAQEAANYIRYAISAVNPVNLPNQGTYDNLISLAKNYTGNTTPEQQNAAILTLTNYLTRLRTYAAQSSVAISNLYYIMSRRIPQTPVSGTGNPSSTALNEYIMASWRLYNPTSASGSASNQQQWLNKINQGSSATVQKEIAILLAEINYQLYLSRMQQERLLLTESIRLMQQGQTIQPDSEMSSSAASSTVSSPAAASGTSS